MTFNQIIEELANTPLYMDICKTYTANDYIKEELYQEFFIVLLKYKEDKIIEMYNNKQLRYFCVGIIKTMATSSKSPFYNKIRKPQLTSIEFNTETEITDDFDNNLDAETLREEFLNDINKFLMSKENEEKRFWYSKQIFELYFVKGMNYRQISEETLIPITSLYYTVLNVKQLIKEEFNLEYQDIKKKILI